MRVNIDRPKNWVKSSSDRLLMNQKVKNIIIKNIFDILFLIHQMIFQNLSQEIEKKANEISASIFFADEIWWIHEWKNEKNELLVTDDIALRIHLQFPKTYHGKSHRSVVYLAVVCGHCD